MKKKLFQIIIFLILLLMFACPSYAIDALIDWRYVGVVELYNYDLTECSINSPIFERIILDDTTKDIVTEYMSADGYRVQSWNVPNDMNDLSNYTTFYRKIPLEYDELYTVNGQKIIVSAEIGYEAGGEFRYDVFYTEDGVEVIQIRNWFEDAGVQFCVNSYYTRDSLVLVQYDLDNGLCEEIEIYNSKWNHIYLFPGETYTILNSMCWRDGYTFSHWTDGTNNNNPGDTFIMPDHDVTLTAVWKKNASVDNDNPFFDWFPIIDQIYNNKSDSDKKDGTTSPSDTYTCPYTDISGHWAEDIIQFIDKLGLIDGITETEFRPDEPMTREMFVTAMARLAGVESDYVNWAIDNGVLLGYGNGEYGLTDTVTREQMAVFFLRFFEKMGIDTAQLHVREAYAFADDETISDWASDAVYEIQSIGLIQGKENNLFDPQGTSTRAEAATVLYNLINTITELDS